MGHMHCSFNPGAVVWFVQDGEFHEVILGMKIRTLDYEYLGTTIDYCTVTRVGWEGADDGKAIIIEQNEFSFCPCKLCNEQTASIRASLEEEWVGKDSWDLFGPEA